MAVPTATPEEIAAEAKKVRRLQLMMDLVMNVISQNDAMSVEEASELIASARRAALNLFPEKELAYDLIYRPRFQRLMTEKYRIQ
jgi:shikimate 5-dehydrogenase